MKKFWDLKLNTKFTVVIIVSLMVIIGVFSGILFYNLENQVKSESSDYVHYTIQRSQDALSGNIDSINMATQFFLSNVELNDVLYRASNGEETSTSEWIDFKNTVISDLERLVNSNPVLYAVRVYATNENVQEMMPILYKNSRMKKQAWAQTENYYGWNYNYKDTLFDSFTMSNDQYIASLITPVVKRGAGEVGVIEASIKMENLFPSLYEEIDLEWGYFVTEDGTILSGGKDSDALPNLLETIRNFTAEQNQEIQLAYVQQSGSHYMLACSPVRELNGHLIFVKDISDKIFHVHRLRNIFIGLMLLFFVIVAFGINSIVRLLLGEFYKILGTVRAVQKGDLDSRIVTKSHDEMGELSRQLNSMLDHIQSLMKENIDREVLVKNSEIRALQNQINAHFIYNVLETIKMMAEIDEEYQIADSLTSLGKLLRYSMRWTSGNVKVAEELEYIHNYVALINLRFDYEIILSIKMSEELQTQEIPKMSLQPIVENAIIHGIEEVAEDTTVYVKGFVDGDDCVIEITDGGKGMHPDQVAELEKRIAGELEASGGGERSNGIGLKNVQDRIRIAFGAPYGLSIISREGLFTKVIVRIPLRTQEHSKADEEIRL